MAPAAIGWLHAPTPQVALLASKAMRARAKVLQAWLQDRPKPPEVTTLDWNDTDYATLLQQANQWAEALAVESRPRIVINLTGGNKPMAMALQRAFGKHADAFGEALSGPYIDTYHKQIEDLLGHADPTPMRSVLNIRDLLALQGITVESAESSADDYAEWSDRTESYTVLLDPTARTWLPTWYRILNFCDWFESKDNRRNLSKQSFDGWQVTFKPEGAHTYFTVAFANAAGGSVAGDPNLAGWTALIDALHGGLGAALDRYEVARVEVDAAAGRLALHIRRTPHDELQFLRGAWLETYLATLFTESGVDDWAQGIQVRLDGVKSECDILAAHGNRLLLIEAKTARLSGLGKGNGDTRSAEVVYKLDSLGDKVGRVFNERWLVSLQPVDPRDRSRAEKYRIKVIQGTKKSAGDLARLREHLGAWVGATQPAADGRPPHSDFAPPSTASANDKTKHKSTAPRYGSRPGQHPSGKAKPNHGRSNARQGRAHFGAPPAQRNNPDARHAPESGPFPTDNPRPRNTSLADQLRKLNPGDPPAKP